MPNPVKSTDLIRLSDRTVGTVAALLDAGRLEMAPEPVRFHSKTCKDGWRWSYWVEEVGTEDEDGDRNAWEVGKTFWQSRVGQAPDVAHYV